jgi:GGDEF domain-containing protein
MPLQKDIFTYITSNVSYLSEEILNLQYQKQPELKTIHQLLSMAYGVIEIPTCEDTIAIEHLLSLADARMYEHKKINKDIK